MPDGRDDDTIEVGYSPLAVEYGGSPPSWQPPGSTSTPAEVEVSEVPAVCQGGAMVLKNLRKRLSTTVDELDSTRLQKGYGAEGVSKIAEAPLRETIVLSGEVKETRVVPRADVPSLEVTIGDGTGRAIVVFTGRR
jgi:hypothetical protein